MVHRILLTGIDDGLLTTRKALLALRGYDSLIVMPKDVDEKLQAAGFDLVILSVMLTANEKLRIRARLPVGMRVLELRTFVLPEQFLGMVAEAFESDAQPCQAFEDISLCAPRLTGNI